MLDMMGVSEADKFNLRIIAGEVPLSNKGFYMILYNLYNQRDKEALFRYLIMNNLTGNNLLQTLANDFMKDNKIDLYSFIAHCRLRSRTTVLL